MNIERFGLPVIIAAGLHGALFLVGRPLTIAAPAALPHRVADAPPVVPVVELIPPDPGEDPGTAAGGVDPLPDIPEPPPTSVRDIPFVVTVDPPATLPDPRVVKISTVSGIPGIDDGPGRFGPPRITSWHELDRPPRVVNQPSPRYPETLRRESVSGAVTVAFVVGTDGRVALAEPVDWSHREFVDAAIDAVMRWRFEPGTVGGRKVRFRIAVPIHFQATD